MADIVGQIAIQIGADISPLTADLSKAQGQISKFGAAAQSSASGGMRAFSLAGTLMASAVVAASVGLVALTKNAIANAGALHDASVATGVHVSQLQAMRQVADEAGVSADELTSSLKRMQNNIDGLLTGTKAQTEAFGRLGLGVRDLQGLSADEQFARIAEAIDRIVDPTQRTAAAMDVFGKTGANLIPMMADYRDVIAEVAQHQKDLGIALSDTDAAKLDDLGDAAGRLKDSAIGLANQFAITFGPALSFAIEQIVHSFEGLNAAFKDLRDFLTQTDAEAKAAALAQMIGVLQSKTEGLATAAETYAVSFEGLADGKISAALRSQADSLRKTQEAFDKGGYSAEEYKAHVDDAVRRIEALLGIVGNLNNTSMDDAIATMESYAASIATALGIAVQLKKTQFSIGATAGSSGGTLNPDGSPGAPASPGVGIEQPGAVNVPITMPRSGGGGGGGGSTLADDLKALQERLATQAEIEMKAYEDAQATLEEALAKKLLTQEQYQTDLEKLQRDHSDRMASIDAGSYGDGAQRMGAYFGVLADTFQSGNERLQKIGRVFGAAEALTNAWRAYTQTLADPSLPFFAKFAAAASVLSAGLGAVNAIRSGGGGGASGGAGAGAASPAAAASPAIANIVVHGDTLPTTSFQSLIDQLNAAFKQGYTLNLVNQ